MPPGQQFDFQLEVGPGAMKGFMLARGRSKGRSWRRTSVPSIPGTSSPNETRFATTAPQLGFREVFDDFSGGFGYAYRAVAPPNGVHWSENLDLRFPGQAVHVQALLTFSSFPPSVGPAGFYDVALPTTVPPGPAGAGGILLAMGNNIVAIPRETGLWQQSGGGSNSAGRRTVTFGSQHVIPAPTGNFMRLMVDMSSTDTAPSVNAQAFVNAGNRLWRAFGPPTRPLYLSSIAAGASLYDPASWSATLPVGNGNYPIGDLTELGGQVFAGLADGLYAGDQAGTFVNVTGQLSGVANLENFRDLTVHDGMVVGQHTSGIYAYTPTNTSGARVRQIGPAWRSNRSPVQGYARAVKSYGGWLYAGLWTGSASFVLAGRDAGGGEYAWNVMHRLPDAARVQQFYFDGITTATSGAAIPVRMWVGTDQSINYGGVAGTAPIYYARIPRLNGNPLVADPVFSVNYVGSARMDLPAFDRGAPRLAKVGEFVQVAAEGFLSGSRYADVYYAADKGPRTLLGRAQTSPVSTLLLGSTNGSFLAFKSLELSLESFNTTPGTCQVYREVVVAGKLRPEYVETIEAVVTAADEATDRRGTPMRPGATVLDDLRALADPLRFGAVPHRLLDLAGATSYVVLDGMPEESETYQEGSENPELVAVVRMVVMTLTQSTQP